MSDQAIIQAFVVGLLALLGAFAGAALTRRTEYEKWLRRERTVAFSNVLREMHQARLYASTVYYEQSGIALEKSSRVTEAFAKMEKDVGIARLFMSASGRSQLSSLINKLRADCSEDGGPARRSTQITASIDNIQTLLESELSHMQWKIKWPFK